MEEFHNEIHRQLLMIKLNDYIWKQEGKMNKKKRREWGGWDDEF